MDITTLKQVTDETIGDIETSIKQNGNGFQETTKVISILFPNGTTGKEQNVLSMAKIIEKMFQISNAPKEAHSTLWKDLVTLSLSALRVSS